ncbi:unnamed protein product [Rotaria socialis]|uniref:TTF-type domain-containing protein n=1 Tax=Rotaria socialis TaxID=392032 RepID=A0A817YXH2_9BILA|nr:unnamed protein product [Rotaria socialis]CAF4928333.1 unnamed protein product [Rotaria socialis]
MENKKSNKRNSTLDNFVISSKKPRDENINLNIISNPPSSSSSSTMTNALTCSSSSSSSITTNTLTCSSSSDNSSTCFIGTDATNLTLNIEYSSPKSSSTTYPTDVSRASEDLPSQPRLAIYPIDKENRSFQKKWYSDHPWMEYSIKLDSVFCYFCRHFSQGGTPTRTQRDAFTTSGFNNWKRALARNRGFDRHVTCQTHIISSANFLQYQSCKKSNTSVLCILDKSRAEQIRINRSKLIKISSAILLCARQLIALRGHNETINSTNRGNLIEILKWSAKTDPLARAVLDECAGNATYLSHQIQNELLNIMANQIRDKIAEKLRGHVYVLLADEATDVSHNKQLSICLRLVDDQYEIQEFFMGFVRLFQFDTVSLAKELSDFLIQHNISFTECIIAQCYDGASVMAGQHNGVQAILQQNFMPRAIYICYSWHENSVEIGIIDLIKDRENRHKRERRKEKKNKFRKSKCK